MIQRALVTPAGLTLEPQPFEAEFLGGPCYRLGRTPGMSADAIGHEIQTLLARAKADGATLITARVPAPEASTIDVLERAGFRRIETLITFERALTDVEPLDTDDSVRLARPGDFDACVEIGRSAFHTDRFHADTRIPKQAADGLKASWVANDLGGRADASFVALADGGPAGFSLCLKRGSVAVIDLIAVAEGQRGRGLGAALVAASLAHCRKSARIMQVGTQASNAASIALYRRLGFAPIGEAGTFHWMP
ncbi:MAG: GNAT family N-acetyltransferase [Alphaproteobacteria bacterium]|nr:GNAT family N-acetyltransferase [Alphaproteobacteria bacterium]